MEFRTRAVLALFLAGLLGAGCSQMLNFSPERTITNLLLEGRSAGGRAQAESIRILQKQEFQESTFILAAYQIMFEDGRFNNCMALYETIPSPTGWRTGSGAGFCLPGDEGPRPLHNGGGMASRDQNPMSYMYGMVGDEAIQWVGITWEDDETQRVEVVGSSYLALRSGNHQGKLVQGFDDAGNLVHSEETPVMSPGKP